MRQLLVTADDFGIGIETSRGILDLAHKGVVTSSVVLVNSPAVEASIALWKEQGMPMELGWHPTLTIDSPVLPLSQVPTLVDENGRFFGLGEFLKRILSERIRAAEVRLELEAQLHRYRDLVGQWPMSVNGHHHIHIFPHTGRLIRSLIESLEPRPFFRHVRESVAQLASVPGARFKRAFLTCVGTNARRKSRAFPGNDFLLGVTDPPYVHDDLFFVRQLRCVPGRVVEITCHPGFRDETLVGRDCTLTDGMLERRVREHQLLSASSFVEECRRQRFVLAKPSSLLGV